jgi:uncharacterized small protein (DUF1192 family)
MPELQIPPVVKLLLEVACLSLKVKGLEREVAELKAELAKRDTPHEA